MMIYLQIPPLLGLITSLVSFAPVAAILVAQIVQDPQSRYSQMYFAAAFSGVAAICAMVMIFLIGINLLKKRMPSSVNKSIINALMVMGVASCVIAAYGFFVQPNAVDDNFFVMIGRVDDDFLRRLIHSARYEILWIGLSAIVMSIMQRMLDRNSNAGANHRY